MSMRARASHCSRAALLAAERSLYSTLTIGILWLLYMIRGVSSLGRVEGVEGVMGVVVGISVGLTTAVQV